MNLLKLRLYKVTVVHHWQPCDLAKRVNVCSWFMQSVPINEVDSYMTFFPVEAWFYLHGRVLS
jgi:hypothetical protein